MKNSLLRCPFAAQCRVRRRFERVSQSGGTKPGVLSAVLALAASVGVSLAFVGAAPSSARVTVERGPALLTYEAIDGGGLCLVRADGTHAVRLTARHKRWENPSWSPDGRYVAFDESSGYDSYSAHSAAKIVVADARGRVRWVFGAGNTNSAPHWSPDGRHILYFAAWAHSGSIDVARPDGSHDHGIAGLGSSAFGSSDDAADPTWTPDGQRLVFDARPDQTSRSIFSAALDGSERTLLVANAAGPAYSPDGSKLAYEGSDSPDGAGVVVANADGSSPRLIFPSTASLSGLAWSPDGTRLAFVAAPWAGVVELVTVRVDGTRTRVVAGPWSEASLVGWSPDGKLIAFERDLSRIYVVSPRGGRPRLLVRDDPSSGAAWRPPVSLPSAKRPACPRR